MNDFRLLILITVVALFPLNSYAEDKDVPKTPLSIFEKATAEISKSLDENQAKQFYAINNSHSIIRTVEDVQQSIARAVVSCTKANPDIKDSMAGRFEVWKEAVRPVVRKAQTKLDKMIVLQDFLLPSQLRAYLRKFDTAIVYRNQKVKSIPVEKLEDCKKLQSSMDGTQNNLVKLITETLALDADLKVKE